MSFFSWLFRRKKKPIDIKLGLALGSGGAKGFAILGALKAFEENDISFDIIAGASIGSIIGAFYADGYTSTDIYEILRHIDAGEIKNFLMMNMNTEGLSKVIDREIGHKNIEDLKKPFFAIATDKEKGTEKVFNSGKVATALCASSCYPPFFKPVVIDDTEYIDGAFTNSVPADVVKNAGADFVVGIDLATHEKKQSFIMSLLPSYKGGVEEPWEKGYKNADIMLHPDLSNYKAVSFMAGSEMYEIGYNTAVSNMEEIKEKIHALRFPTKKKKGKRNA